MKLRTASIAQVLGRTAIWTLGTGLILIGIGEAINAAMLCVASEKQP